MSAVPEHLLVAFEALVTEEYRAEHETIGPVALGALEDCSEPMPRALCGELHLPDDSTYADGVAAYCELVTYGNLSLSQLVAVAKESEEEGIQLGILHVLCALRGDREALAAIGPEWTLLLRDAVHRVFEAEQDPAGPREFFRADRVGEVVRGEDRHLLTDEEFDAEWGWWS